MRASYTTATASAKRTNGETPSTNMADSMERASLKPLSIKPSNRHLTGKATGSAEEVQ